MLSKHDVTLVARWSIKKYFVNITYILVEVG